MRKFASPFSQALHALALTCDDLLTLVESKFARKSTHRLRAVPLSLSPSSETRLVRRAWHKKWPREILGARSTVLAPRISRGLFFFLAGFFRISLDGLSDRGSTRSLFMIEKSDFEWFSLIERNCFGSRTSKYAQNFTQKIVQIQRKNQVLFVYHVHKSLHPASPSPTSPSPHIRMSHVPVPLLVTATFKGWKSKIPK